ncbi:MAG: hypothetical protein N2B06_08540, partial [Clostridium sp.]
MNENMDNNKINEPNETDENTISFENSNLNENMDDSRGTTNDGDNENIIGDEPAYGFTEKHSETQSIVLQNNDSTEINHEKEKKNKGGMRNRIMSYIIVGVICST